MDTHDLCLSLRLRKDLLGLDENQFNISSLVLECPRVCELVYGTGNSDISGIGVSISYVMQVALMMLFGPILYILLELSHRIKNDIFDTILDHMKHMFRMLHRTSTFLALMTMITATFSLSKSPTTFEIIFLHTLISLQAYICAMSVVVHSFTIGSGEDKLQDEVAKVIDICVWIGSLVFGSKCEAMAHPNSLVGQITSACIQVEGWLAPPSTGMSKFTAITFLVCLFVVPFTFRFFSYLLEYYGIRQLVIKYLKPCWPSLIALSSLVTLISLTGDLMVKRTALEAKIPRLNDVDGWGFGQVTAIMLWIPSFLDLASHVYETSCPPSKRITTLFRKFMIRVVLGAWSLHERWNERHTQPTPTVMGIYRQVEDIARGMEEDYARDSSKPRLGIMWTIFVCVLVYDISTSPNDDSEQNNQPPAAIEEEHCTSPSRPNPPNESGDIDLEAQDFGWLNLEGEQDRNRTIEVWRSRVRSSSI